MPYHVQLPDLEYYQRAIKCQAACPVRTDARAYVTAIAAGDDERAYRIARESNPFASVCGRVCAAPCEDACRRGSVGTLPTDITFTGHRSESGLGSLMYFRARFYSPTLGRFVSADSIVPGAGNPQALNRYAYALSNPLKYTDPSGHVYLCAQACEDQLDGIRPPKVIWTRLSRSQNGLMRPTT